MGLAVAGGAHRQSVRGCLCERWASAEAGVEEATYYGLWGLIIDTELELRAASCAVTKWNCSAKCYVRYAPRSRSWLQPRNIHI